MRRRGFGRPRGVGASASIILLIVIILLLIVVNRGNRDNPAPDLQDHACQGHACQDNQVFLIVPLQVFLIVPLQVFLIVPLDKIEQDSRVLQTPRATLTEKSEQRFDIRFIRADVNVIYLTFPKKVPTFRLGALLQFRIQLSRLY